ncbi:MAG: CCA tRNA nucleotidyltransferase [Clostridia bacterium]|nr:CCA tRNA nucleotidyltransferase [Clostridia bacterium]
MENIPKSLKLLASIFKNNNKKLYIVGGFVRDYLANIPNNDIDLCSPLTLEELENLLYKTEFKIEINNKQFGTAKIIYNDKVFEYCTFRTDCYSNNGKHSPKKVEFTRDINLDAKRRDFTINAIYFDLIKNSFVDIFYGKKDIKNRLIKAVPNIDETLSKDGERLLRMAKFKAKLGFYIDKQTLNVAKKYSNNLKDLSKNTINKFLQSINNFSLIQKQNIKEVLLDLNAQEIANKII